MPVHRVVLRWTLLVGAIVWAEVFFVGGLLGRLLEQLHSDPTVLLGWFLSCWVRVGMLVIFPVAAVGNLVIRDERRAAMVNWLLLASVLVIQALFLAAVYSYLAPPEVQRVGPP